MLSAAEIQEGLSQFYGTESYHRLGLDASLVATDGVAWLCKSAQCYWLMDLIASYQPKCRQDLMLQSMQFWTLKVNADQSATVSCERDEGDIAFTQDIECTTFPLREIKIWVESGECGGQAVMVAMLPSER